MHDSITKLHSCQVATERKKGHVLLKLHPALQEAWWPSRFPKPVGQPCKQTLHLHLLDQQSELDHVQGVDGRLDYRIDAEVPRPGGPNVANGRRSERDLLEEVLHPLIN